MKLKTVFVAWLAIALHAAGRAAAPAAAADAQVIARVHHGALQQLLSSGESKGFQEIWKLPATAQFRDQTLEKLAVAAASHFQARAGGHGGSCAALLQPLLGALAANEMYVEIRDLPAGGMEAFFAVRLDQGRVQSWESNVSQLLSGWELRQGQGQLARAATNSWFLLHWTSTAGAASDRASSLLAELARGAVPRTKNAEWLSLDAKLARCAPWFSVAAGTGLPDLTLTVTPKKELLRTDAQFTFREPLRAKLQKWEIPMHIIRDPLISFTACQGFADWLDQQPLFKELGLKSVPNQLYLWGLSYTLFQVQAAVPVSDSAGAFDRIQKIWVPKSNPVLAEYAVGKMDRLTNQTEIVWRGLPIIVPYLEPARDSGQEYLRAGIFPITQPTNPPPAALFEQLTSQTNLVYYDWEITQARLNQLRPLLQLGSVFLNIAPMSTNSAAFKWLDAIEPKLGNAATEVTQTSPRELKLVRTSHIGLNGLEILALANWLEGTNFPHIDVGMHFRPVLRASHPKPTR